VNLEVTGASKSAIEAVEKAGGSLKVAAAAEYRVVSGALAA
jgi:large subunit ribosomal protein L15